MNLPVSRSGGLLWKAAIAARIWSSALLVSAMLRTHTVADVVERLGRSRRSAAVVPPARLSRAVDRTLQVGPWQPRCLIRSLVLYRLLAAQGERPHLVIGLPVDAIDHTAHAWVELAGRDVGPAPGRGGHVELARYPSLNGQ